jgi:hypothetical protein
MDHEERDGSTWTHVDSEVVRKVIVLRLCIYARVSRGHRKPIRPRNVLHLMTKLKTQLLALDGMEYQGIVQPCSIFQVEKTVKKFNLESLEH